MFFVISNKPEIFNPIFLKIKDSEILIWTFFFIDEINKEKFFKKLIPVRI